jgi:hypothetical protein
VKQRVSEKFSLARADALIVCSREPPAAEPIRTPHAALRQFHSSREKT